MLNKAQKNLLEVSIHLILALCLALWIYLKVPNYFYVLMVFLGGTLIDLDHLFDHFLFYRHKFSLSDFLNTRYLKSGKIYLPLHSWEFNLIIFILGVKLDSLPLLILSLSISLHLAVDNIQRKNPLFYLLIYRIYKKFDLAVLLPEAARDGFIQEGKKNIA